jgi:tRNA pseudouridine38-40 synthase
VTTHLLLEYDGADFAGWARQPGLRTVQETVEGAIRTIGGTPVELTVAGRTDAGVHARGQVASHAGAPVAADSLNGVLPADVRVLASELAPDDFDARRDARSRIYRYRVHARRQASPFERGRALHWPRRLERDALDA